MVPGKCAVEQYFHGIEQVRSLLHNLLGREGRASLRWVMLRAGGSAVQLLFANCTPYLVEGPRLAAILLNGIKFDKSHHVLGGGPISNRVYLGRRSDLTDRCAFSLPYAHVDLLHPSGHPSPENWSILNTSEAREF